MPGPLVWTPYVATQATRRASAATQALLAMVDDHVLATPTAF